MEKRTGWSIENGTGEIASMSADTSYSDARRRAQELADEQGETIYLVENTSKRGYLWDSFEKRCYSSGVFEPRSS